MSLASKHGIQFMSCSANFSMTLQTEILSTQTSDFLKTNNFLKPLNSVLHYNHTKHINYTQKTHIITESQWQWKSYTGITFATSDNFKHLCFIEYCTGRHIIQLINFLLIYIYLCHTDRTTWRQTRAPHAGANARL